jgi:hypothetical protein
MTPKLGGFDGPTAEEENAILLDELQKQVPAEHHGMLDWLKGACECYCLCDAGSAAMTCHPCAARKMLLATLAPKRTQPVVCRFCGQEPGYRHDCQEAQAARTPWSKP